jgi:uncharacterized membrane protein YidH (DUF202 family)
MTQTDLSDEINKLQLLLSEKRTELSLARTGIALFALPLSVVSVLIATSHYYDSSKVLPLLIPVLSISAALILLGGLVIILSYVKYRSIDRKIGEVKKAHDELRRLIT